jgi:alpha-tubulin suppressor-like RCC1 family protein
MYWDHACAVLAGGTIKCWGHNPYGELGDGTTTDSNVPVDVVGITDATQIGVGYHDACAVLADGTARCWGSGQYGVLGNGAENDSNVPVDVTDLTDATQINVLGSRACALVTGGGVKCWGNEVGNGYTGTGNFDVPQTVVTYP